MSAWISDETETSFVVNIALSKWTAEPLGAFTGYTLQFEHQGKQFGVAAFFDGMEWEYSNAYIDLENGDGGEFTASTGTFTPGSPALLTILFDKGHFVHGDASDNRLVNFAGGSADFKSFVPWFFAPIPLPPPTLLFFCDEVASDAVYTFQVGGHSAHASGSGGSGAAGNATAPAGPTPTAPGALTPAADAPAPAPAVTVNDTPGPGAVAVLVAAVAALLLARRRQ